MLRFLEWVCGELLRHDEKVWKIQMEATRLVIRKYAVGFVASLSEGILYPTRP